MYCVPGIPEFLEFLPNYLAKARHGNGACPQLVWFLLVPSGSFCSFWFLGSFLPFV